MASPRDVSPSIVAALPLLVLVVDREGNIAVHNGHNGRLLNVLPVRVEQGDALEGRRLAELIPYDPLLGHIREVRENGAPKEIEFRWEGPGAELKVLRILVAPMVGSDHVLLVLEDASERVLREDELIDSEKLVAMRQLARSVAHELGNPLSVMQSALQHVYQSLCTQGGGELAECVEAIVDNVARMDELLRSISEFKPPRPPRFEPTDIARLITDVTTFIRMEAVRWQVGVRLRLADPLPPCLVDTRRMKQVFLNLFKNALEAMPRGGVLEITSRLAGVAGEERIMVTIRDTGIGVSKDDLRLVFRPLFSTKPGGMGLGLPFCREVVEEHGGEVRFESRKGKGTTVTITLPLNPQ